MSTVDVRQATVEDADVVGTLLHDFNAEFDTPTDPPATIADRFARQSPERLVALLGGDPPVGLAVVSFRPVLYSDGPVALLDELYVRPARRNAKIGHALLLAVERAARDRGAPVVEINVDGEDHDARRFYEAHGYAHTEPGGTEPSFYYYRELPSTP